MNLEANISVYAGGSGSGCKGSNCGRPKILYHVTDENNLSGILKKGLKTQSAGAVTKTEFPGYYDKNAVYAIKNPKEFKTVIENKLYFGELERDR